MNPTDKYAIIFWKNINRDKFSVRTFEDEQEMVDFAEQCRMERYGTMVAERVNVRNGEEVYKVRNYGAYPFFKHLYKLIGLFLIGLIIFLILSWK
jgi:hypothetical protein